jgi:hypothetical protein
VQRNQSLTGTARPDLGPLAPAEVDAIRRFAAAHPNDVRPRADFSIAVGAAVPTSVDLSPLPPDLAHALPHYAGDLYIVIGNQFIAVERQTRRIVAIVPLPAVGENTR